MYKLNFSLFGLLVVAGLAACSDPLNVQNINNPDRSRIYSRPADLEGLISDSYRQWHQGTVGGSDYSIPSQARAWSWENASGLANWGMGLRASIPRVFIDNSRGNQTQQENLKDFNATQRSARAAADGINRISVGKVSLGSAAQDARAQAFAWFVLGISQGATALIYDSAAIIDPYAELTAIPDLTGYKEIAAAALVDLDSALKWTTAATTAGGANGFPLPSGWINGNALTAADFTKLIRSWKAVIRANVARDPTERAAVDWTQVRDDAAAGITADLYITTVTSPSWSITLNQAYLYGGWHQAAQFLIGMADSTGAYDAFLAAPYAAKTMFLVQTADRRFPPGATRAAQQAASPALPPAGRYFRNRTGLDNPADNYQTSMYDWYRPQAWYNANQLGPYPVFLKAQNDLLRAEALIRLGDIPGAATLIDISRTAAGLPALSGVITTAAQTVPGGAACVPRVPQPPSYTSAGCGTIMEAMKWEYRMETMYTNYCLFYISGRGWGDLPEGTATSWPVPYQELDTRNHPIYNLGGVGKTGGSVGKGTYGL